MPGTPLKLIVGLGNPGSEYSLTRHNAGFWFVDALAERLGGRFRNQSRFQGDTCRVTLAGQEITLLKPMTFMNRSGLSIRGLADFTKVAPNEILLAHDELDVPVGEVRLKLGGGHGGHNGLRDTIAHIGADFWRLRIGIGHPGNRDEVVDYVLRRASAGEEDKIIDAVAAGLDVLPTFIEQGAERAMNSLHRKS